jgi:hypothetical protein
MLQQSSYYTYEKECWNLVRCMKSTEEEGTEDKTLPWLMGKVRSSNQQNQGLLVSIH